MKHTKPNNLSAPSSSSAPSPQRRRGIALILVLAAVALATVVGLTMLSTSAIHAQVSNNSSDKVAGEYLADSGVQAALYYLQYPHLMPPGWGTTAGYYAKASNVAMPYGQGSFDLEVTAAGEADVYNIKSSARGASPQEILATAKVHRAKIDSAGHFGGSITLPLGVTVDGPLTINGLLTNLTGLLFGLVKTAPLPPSSYRVPSSATINWYGADQPDRRYLMPDGTVGYAQQLAAAPVAAPAAAADNPGRVFFYSNTTAPDLVMTSAVNINGTLIVKGGSLSVRANGITITPVGGMPALLIERDLNMYRTNAVLVANGAVWVGRNVTWTTMLGLSTGTSGRVNGALLMPAGSAIAAPGVGGTLTLKYVAANVDVPLLNRLAQPGESVSVLSWNE
jgi:hypothetical protein